MKTRKLAALSAAIAMAASMTAMVVPVEVSAAGSDYGSNALLTSDVSHSSAYSDNSGTALTKDITTQNTTLLKKILEVEDDANIPACTFTFTASAGTAKEATGSTLAVLAGVNPDKIIWNDVTVSNNAFSTAESGTTQSNTDTISYTASDVTIDNTTFSNSAIASGGDTMVVLSEGNDGTYYAEKEMQLDFSNCGFTEPGVYRYIITESDNTQLGVTNDSNLTRTIDVYVEDASYYTRTGTEGNYTYTYNKKLRIAGYVMYVDTQTTGPSNSSTTTEGSAVTMEDNSTKTPNGMEVSGATKSVGFKNEYTSHDLTFGKEVTGNQGSKDKYFDFTVTISGATAGTVYDVDISNADATSGTNSATITANQSKSNVTSITVGNDGTATAHFYLQDGQYITILGLAEGTKYDISENKEDYSQTAGIAANLSTLDWNGTAGYDALSDAVKNTTGITADVHTGFTNDRSGTIPTGILSTVGGSAALAVVGIAGIAGGAMYLRKKKSEED